MSDEGTDGSADSSTRERHEIARKVADAPSEFISLMTNLYRGEIGRATTWRTRLDRTTNWSVVVIASLITWTFSGRDRPHYILIAGMLFVGTFLLIETRRYRVYDVYRARVRMVEENVFANAVDPEGAIHEEWRELVSTDLREPTKKMPLVEGLSRRLKRIYLPLNSILIVAWFLRVTIFEPDNIGIIQGARIEFIPGHTVIIGVLLYYGLLIALTFWPIQRHAKGEIEEKDHYSRDWREE